MNREEIEHLIRAAGAITQSDEIIIIGSQSILGAFPNAPKSLLKSREAGLIPVQHPEHWNLIDGVLGELSPFDETFGYFADGVEENTAILPKGWKNRLVRIKNENTANISGLCLEPHDLMASKLIAARDKDLEFVSAALTEKLVSAKTIEERLNLLPSQKNQIKIATAWLNKQA
ncbi:MAG TPA: hypothetical protein DD827_01610 [Gammaproteobacteria bacterium]|jgi:hypothetical protein|nr:hypothetical protein [Gammaproteobacteria bacterium]